MSAWRRLGPAAPRCLCHRTRDHYLGLGPRARKTASDLFSRTIYYYEPYALMVRKNGRDCRSSATVPGGDISSRRRWGDLRVLVGQWSVRPNPIWLPFLPHSILWD